MQDVHSVVLEQAAQCLAALHFSRYAKVAGVGIASLGLTLSANAASVKLGADGGALVFDPATITIKAGESVTWTNNVGFPHNVVFDEDAVPVRASHLSRSSGGTLVSPVQFTVFTETTYCMCTWIANFQNSPVHLQRVQCLL